LHDGIPDSSFSQNDTIAKSMAKKLSCKTGTTIKEQENLVNGLLPVKTQCFSFSKPTFITMRVEDLAKICTMRNVTETVKQLIIINVLFLLER
jgi:DNA mismatch repair protein MutL